jgi:putative SOS response-associated peptidase YedK
MCGRFSQFHSTEQIVQRFMVHAATFDFGPRYNIAPSQTLPAIVAQDDQVILKSFQWGLVPSWAKDRNIGARMINARSETVAEKPAYRAAFKSRRCLIPADGFYEWKKSPGRNKTPMYIHLDDNGLFAFAGLWESWTDPVDGSTLETCTICTTTPNRVMAPIHDRMPALLNRDAESRWLDPSNQDVSQLESLLQPYPTDQLRAHAVSPFVNSPRNDSPRCIDVAPEKPDTLFD